LQLGCQDDPHGIIVVRFEPEDIGFGAVAIDRRRKVAHQGISSQ
jgi:hypothetical protein